MALGLDIRGTQPSPGNIRGGLTTIEEKSLGATHKGGERAPLEDVVAVRRRRSRSKGLTVMDTPGLDVESVTGMVGGGAQVVVFTTGLGTPTGNPDRAGHQDHRQRPHGAADGRQHRPRRQRHHGRHRDARRARPIGCSTRCWPSPPGSRRRPSGSATASSRFIGAIPRSEGPERMPTSSAAAAEPFRSPASRWPDGSAAIRWVICGAAVLRRDDQLHRPPGHRHPQADAAEGVRLERDRLRRHRVRVPARLRDRLSVRRPDDRSARDEERLRVALVVWSLAAMAHAEAPVFGPAAAAMLALVGLTYTASVAGFIFARLFARLRRGRQLSRRRSRSWRSGFPKRERAFATGIFNSGTNIGALVTPLVVPWITLYWGWYWAFVMTGALGFLWLVVLDSALRSARRVIRASARPSSRTSAAIRRIRRRTCRGCSCCATARPGRSRSASS